MNGWPSGQGPDSVRPASSSAAQGRVRAWLAKPISVRAYLLVAAGCIAFVIALPLVLLQVKL